MNIKLPHPITLKPGITYKLVMQKDVRRMKSKKWFSRRNKNVFIIQEVGVE